MFESDSYIIQTDNNASYALRVLSLVNNNQVEKTINKIYENHLSEKKYSSDLVRMNAVYAMTNLGNVKWLNNRVKDFPDLSSWEKRAVIASTSFLGESGRDWRTTYRAFCSPMENLVGDWVSEKHAVHSNWKLPL